MPKRKRHPVLPNGWGTIRYLGKNRTNPYAVHPPCTERYENGYYKRPPVLCYVKDWYTGFAVLNAYRAGTYHPGDELNYPTRTMSDRDMDEFCQRILRDRSYTAHLDDLIREKTFSEVYKEWHEWKFGENAPKKLSASVVKQTRASYSHLSPLHNRAFSALRLKDLQDAVNKCDLAYGTLQKVVVLLKQIYRYAYTHEMIDRDYSVGLITPQRRAEKHGQPFTEEDLKILWEEKEDPCAELLLILCYSGWRIGEYQALEVNLEERWMKGGSKTDAGKDRIVPIHSAILPLVKHRIEEGKLMFLSENRFRRRMNEFIDAHGMEHHSPHDCRHTFSTLCERYGVREADRKRMLGHAVGDITNDTYGHRTVEELRTEIEKILCPVVSSRP